MRWGVVRKKLSPDCSMVVRLLGCLLWVLLGSSVFACFLLCLCVCLAGFQCKECQSRLSCRIPWRINMNSPPFVMASNWRQISGWLFLSNETYVFPHMQNSSAIPILGGSGATLRPQQEVSHALGGGQEETLPRLINLGRIRPDRPKALATPLEYVLRVKLIIKIFVGFVNRAASSMGWAAGPLHGGCCSPSNNTTAGSRTCPSCGCPWASVRKKLFSHGSRARP